MSSKRGSTVVQKLSENQRKLHCSIKLRSEKMTQKRQATLDETLNFSLVEPNTLCMGWEHYSYHQLTTLPSVS